MYTSEDKYQLKQFGARLADTNYYNQYHKIVRIRFSDKFYDFKYLGGIDVPNPAKHIAVVVSYDEAVNGIGILGDRLSLLPGLLDEEGNLADLPIGFVYLIPLNQSSSNTNLNSGGSGFSINNLNMSDLEKLSIAISPPTNTDYTSKDTGTDGTKVKDGQKDLSDENVGIFINTDGVILIKSKGASIALGDDGVYIGGKVSWESSEHQREWLMDNQLQRFIPSTIPTAAIAIPELPNIAKFAQIAEGARKVRDIVSKGSKIAGLL